MPRRISERRGTSFVYIEVAGLPMIDETHDREDISLLSQANTLFYWRISDRADAIVSRGYRQLISVRRLS